MAISITMTFGQAITALKDGKKVARLGWNGKNMWLIYVPATNWMQPESGTPYHRAGVKGPITIDPHIDMMTAQGTMQPGWQPTQSDMLAMDWFFV